MPQIFRIGSYLIYFGADENDPLEPIHVHVSRGVPSGNSTKIWITKSGHCLVANNNSHISKKTLNYIIKIIEARHIEIVSKWNDFFGKITYYC